MSRGASERGRPSDSTTWLLADGPGIVERVVSALDRDLADATWAAPHDHLCELAEHDAGPRFLVARTS